MWRCKQNENDISITLEIKNLVILFVFNWRVLLLGYRCCPSRYVCLRYLSTQTRIPDLIPIENCTYNFTYENVILYVNYFNFHMWFFRSICEIHISYTKISQVKFWTNSFHMSIGFFIYKFPFPMWKENFIRENAPIPNRFHKWNDMQNFRHG